MTRTAATTQTGETATTTPPARYTLPQEGTELGEKQPVQPANAESGTAKNGVHAKKGKPKKKSKTFAVAFEAVSVGAYLYVQSLVGHFDEVTQNLFKHVLCCSGTWDREEDPFLVPIPEVSFKRKHFRKADLKGLVSAGLLYPHYIKEGITYRDGYARRFTVAAGIMRRYEELDAAGASGKLVNLFTGKVTIRRAKHATKNNSGNSHPDIIRSAWKKVKPASYHLANAERVVQRRQDDLLLAQIELDYAVEELVGIQWIDEMLADAPESQWGRLIERETAHIISDESEVYSHVRDGGIWLHEYECDSIPYSRAEELAAFHVALTRYQQARGRLSNDLAALNAIRKFSEPVGGDIYRRQEVYAASSTGRSTAKSGMFQNCSRELKQALFGDVPGVFNYDMESSQDYILRECFQQAGIRCEWLENALEGRNFKAEIADATGLTRDTAKRCLHALKMGAGLSESEESDIYCYIVEEVGADDAPAVLKRFRECVRPLVSSLRKWRKYLTNEWVREEGHYSAGRLYVRNDIGMTFCVSDYTQAEEAEERNKLPRKLAAFVLQGREAQFVYELTLLSDRYGFSVVSLQHDGVISEGEIPEAAVEEARQKTGMDYVRLVVKPFV